MSSIPKSRCILFALQPPLGERDDIVTFVDLQKAEES